MGAPLRLDGYSLSDLYGCASGMRAVAPDVVRGRVVDDEGEPLPRVQVYLKGAGVGTITAEDGKFMLRALCALGRRDCV